MCPWTIGPESSSGKKSGLSGPLAVISTETAMKAWRRDDCTAVGRHWVLALPRDGLGSRASTEEAEEWKRKSPPQKTKQEEGVVSWSHAARRSQKMRNLATWRPLGPLFSASCPSATPANFMLPVLQDPWNPNQQYQTLLTVPLCHFQSLSPNSRYNTGTWSLSLLFTSLLFK